MRVRTPAEWEPHRATWLIWPSQEDGWGQHYTGLLTALLDAVYHIAPSEVVEIVCPGNEFRDEVQAMLVKRGVTEGAGSSPKRGFRLHTVKVETPFIRDSGATPVYRDSQLSWNKWGSARKHSEVGFPAENRLPNYQARITESGCVEACLSEGVVPVIMEGGVFDVDGQGTLLTTEQCLLSRDTRIRNEGLSRHDYEELFQVILGIEKVIWLPFGSINHKINNAHIEWAARFVGSAQLVVSIENDPCGHTYEILQENLARLKGVTDCFGQSIKVFTLPVPAPLQRGSVTIHPSYTGFYVANRSVIVPVFNDEHDLEALTTIKEIFPSKRVIGVYAGDLLERYRLFRGIFQYEPLRTTD